MAQPVTKTMNARVLWKWELLLALIVPFANGCVERASSSTEATPSLGQAEKQSEVIESAAAESDTPEETADTELAEAPVQPISTEKPNPPDIEPGRPLSEVIKLAEAGVDEHVLLVFITNSSGTFNLRSEEIIFLKDLGLPGDIATAMIEHDHLLRETS